MVSAIMVVITSVILVSNGRFGGVVQLESLAYDVALSIRQAQVYGISVARFGENTFSAGYGVHFDTSNPNTFSIFADIHPLAPGQNGMYDPAQEENVATTNITNGYSIQALCAAPLDGVEHCGDVTSVDIVFIRPEPDAYISTSDVSCILQSGSCQASARIVLVSPRGDTMSVVVDASGQISVQRGI